jgi:hypothetical protein
MTWFKAKFGEIFLRSPLQVHHKIGGKKEKRRKPLLLYKLAGDDTF